MSISAPVAIEVILRFDVPPDDVEAFQTRLAFVLELFGRQSGFVSGWLAQSIDEAEVAALGSRWERVGDWRRALSSPEVKLHASEVLYRCRMEPTVFEVVRQIDAVDGVPTVRSGQSARAADADAAAPGAAAAASVRPAWRA